MKNEIKKLNEQRAYLEALEDTMNFVERMYDIAKLNALEKLYKALDNLA